MKKAIMVVSFGTTDKNQLEHSVMACIQSVEKAFGDYDTYYAFSSDLVIRRLEESDVHIPSMKEAIETIIQKGYKELLVQPLHLMAGKEYTKVCNLLEVYKEQIDYEIGMPLLLEQELELIAEQMLEEKEETFNLWIGHGSDHEASSIYKQLNEHLKSRGTSSMLMTLEDVNECQDVVDQMRRLGKTQLYIRPLMLVAGNHMIQDIAGEHDKSWRAAFMKQGVEPIIEAKGIGEYAWLHELIHRRIGKMIDEKGYKVH